MAGLLQTKHCRFLADQHPAALRHFEALPPSHRRRYLAWIESAKQEKTKLRRLKEALRLLADGKVLGLK